MFARTLTLLTAFLVASGSAKVIDDVLQDFGANLRGTVFDFDCEHIYFVFFKEGQGLLVHKASTKDIPRRMQLLGGMKPMQEVFPDIYSMIVEYIPTNLFHTIEYISSSTYYQLRKTGITSSSSEIIYTEYEDKHDSHGFSKAREHQVVHSISTCQRSAPQSHFHFQSDYEIKRQDYLKKANYEQLFKVWVADKSDDIYITTNDTDEQKAKSLSYSLFNFEYFKRGFWHKEYTTLFQSTQAPNPSVLVFRGPSKGMKTFTMLWGSCKVYFDSGLTSIETSSKTTTTTTTTSFGKLPILTFTTMIIVVLVAACCFTFLCTCAYLSIVKRGVLTEVSKSRKDPKKMELSRRLMSKTKKSRVKATGESSTLSRTHRSSGYTSRTSSPMSSMSAVRSRRSASKSPRQPPAATPKPIQPFRVSF